MKLPPFIIKALRWWPVGLLLLVVDLGAGATSMLQAHNADQLVNGLLFENYQTFAGAIFPAEHTQLLKWPLFMLPRLFHFAPLVYTALTVLLVLITIGVFLYILYVIARRRVVFGVLCVLLASVLLLVPMQVFDGGVTAPLGMAMLTGRNVEYVAYLAALIVLIKAPKLHSWWLVGCVALLSLLFASDRLFMYMNFGGVVLLGAAAIITGHKALRHLARNWLVASVLAGASSLAIQAAIGHAMVRLIASSQHYEHVTGLAGIGQGVIGTLQALALTFGLTARAGYGSLPALLLNVCTATLVIYAGYAVVRHVHNLRQKDTNLPLALGLAAMLLASSFATIVGFALMNQPYMQQARYLTITLFSGFVVLAVWLRTIAIKLPAVQVWSLAVAGSACVLLALAASVAHTNTLRANDRLAERNQKIVALLQKHPVDYLVGNYWRVVPIRAATPGARQAISPLQGCIQPTTVLTSGSWRPDLLTHSFAYVLTRQPLGVPQQACTMRTLTWLYGQPSSKVVISGPQSIPHEVLLFYDNGAAGVRRP